MISSALTLPPMAALGETGEHRLPSAMNSPLLHRIDGGEGRVRRRFLSTSWRLAVTRSPLTLTLSPNGRRWGRGERPATLFLRRIIPSPVYVDLRRCGKD